MYIFEEIVLVDQDKRSPSKMHKEIDSVNAHLVPWIQVCRALNDLEDDKC